MMREAQAINALDIRRKLGRQQWSPPTELGEDAWVFDSKDERRIIVSQWTEQGVDWLHASVSRYGDAMPTYDDLKLMHQAVFRGYAYQVFAPTADHINIKTNVLHLWGRVDGALAMPNFGKLGTI